MKFLDGFKTALGTLGLALVVLSDATTIQIFPLKWQPYITGAAGLLLALGLVHKVEKAQTARDAE